MKTAEIILEYQNEIQAPPVPKEALYQQACSHDGQTINSWRDTWIKHAKANKERFGSFAENGIGKLFGAHQYKPCILAGSGPSLKGNGAQLKDRGEIPLISCLHNFHFFEDAGVKVDYYVSLDAGPVTVEEVSEGGKLSADEYWERTANHTLLCYVGTHPDLLSKWQGKIYFFNAPVPDEATRKGVNDVEVFNAIIGSGGNVLGASLYIARAVLGCSSVAFVGADFSFGYDYKFHGWDSKYDKSLGQCMYLTDVYGIRRKTWPSYANFKAWFDWVALNVPGVYYNCTEGGCLGAYPEGNLSAFKYLDLKDYLDVMHMNKHVREQFLNPNASGTELKLLF